MFFKNRIDAGKSLADIFLKMSRDFSGWNVVGIARGGVIVGSQIAKALKLPLQAFCVDNKDKQLFYNNGPFRLKNRIILCDDGVVTGKSLFRVIDALQHYNIKDIIVAIPVVPPWLTEKDYGFELVTWRVTKLKNPTTGIFYFNFDDVPDFLVREAVINQ